MAMSDAQRLEPTRPGLRRKDSAAAFLGISPRTLDRMLARREGPKVIVFGKQRLFREEDLERFLEEHAVGGNGTR